MLRVLNTSYFTVIVVLYVCLDSRVDNSQTLVWDLLYCRLTFPGIFYICLKSWLFHIPLQNNQQAPYRYCILTLFCKKDSVGLRRKGKSVPPHSHLLGLGRSMACGNMYVKHFVKFRDFFETQCWQPCLIVSAEIVETRCRCWCRVQLVSGETLLEEKGFIVHRWDFDTQPHAMTLLLLQAMPTHYSNYSDCISNGYTQLKF